MLREAEEKGLEATLSNGPLADLAALADAARYMRRNDVARQALVAERARFRIRARLMLQGSCLRGWSKNRATSSAQPVAMIVICASRRAVRSRRKRWGVSSPCFVVGVIRQQRCRRSGTFENFRSVRTRTSRETLQARPRRAAPCPRIDRVWRIAGRARRACRPVTRSRHSSGRC